MFGLSIFSSAAQAPFASRSLSVTQGRSVLAQK
jgi:hypothetical protein